MINYQSSLILNDSKTGSQHFFTRRSNVGKKVSSRIDKLIGEDVSNKELV